MRHTFGSHKNPTWCRIQAFIFFVLSLVWLHVDACWGGAVILSKKRRHLMAGSDQVDSIAWNPHKMVGAPLQGLAVMGQSRGNMKFSVQGLSLKGEFTFFLFAN